MLQTTFRAQPIDLHQETICYSQGRVVGAELNGYIRSNTVAFLWYSSSQRWLAGDSSLGFITLLTTTRVAIDMLMSAAMGLP